MSAKETLLRNQMLLLGQVTPTLSVITVWKRSLQELTRYLVFYCINSIGTLDPIIADIINLYTLMNFSNFKMIFKNKNMSLIIKNVYCLLGTL